MIPMAPAAQDHAMLKVLMIAYFFPPLGGIGAQRTLKFARYLPQFGWQPVILTAQGSPHPARDPELMAQVPSETPVFRARTVEPEHLYNLYRRLVPSYQQKSGKGPNTRKQGAATDNLAAGQADGTGRQSLAARLQAWLCVPDGRIGWLPFALKVGKQILKAERPSVIFSTAPPYTAHLVARTLAEWSKCPLVIDFRDPWVSDSGDFAPTRLHRSLAARLEAKCVRRADRVICVTPLMSHTMRSRYADQPESKFITITNGFDSGDFDSQCTPGADHFSIRHIGSLYSNRSAIPFLTGLVLALQRDPTMKQTLQVEFIGLMDRQQEQAWHTFVATHELQPWVSRQPFVGHDQAVRLMQQSQVQLLLAGQGENMDSPAKLFEYLGARRPILVMAPPGVAVSLVRELEAGLVASADEPEEVANAILSFYSLFQQGKLQGWSAKDLSAYERRHLTGQLASLLDDLMVKHRG
jgi:glycosyltransferase involved in cell wall biosynthesis